MSFTDRLPPDFYPPDPESPRGRILDAARKLFAERGFEASSIRAIAEAAAVNLAMVNYYYGSKDLLYRRVIAQQFLSMLRDLATGLPDDLTPREAILGQPRRMLNVIRRHPDWVRLIKREISDGGDRLQRVLLELGDQGPLGAMGQLIGISQDAVAAGEIRPLPPVVVVEFLLSLSYGLMFMCPVFQLFTGTDFSNDRVWENRLDAFESILRHGLQTGEAR